MSIGEEGAFEIQMFSLCRMFNSSTIVEFTTSSPFFANAMLGAAVFAIQVWTTFIKSIK